MSQIVLVYGTLRAGLPNHHLLKTAKFLGSGKLLSQGTMYSNGGFPILSFADGLPKSDIIVEAYVVDEETFRRLDQLEGYRDERDHWYNRTAVPAIINVDGELDQLHHAWVYHQDKKFGLPIVHSGDWKKHYSQDRFWDSIEIA